MPPPLPAASCRPTSRPTSGGGIANSGGTYYANGSTLNLTNTIVAGNTATVFSPRHRRRGYPHRAQLARHD